VTGSSHAITQAGQVAWGSSLPVTTPDSLQA